MVTVRRWYVFLVCAVSVQAITWAAIELAQNALFLPSLLDVAAIALPGALVVVGLPLYLAHWLWAQRLAARDSDERSSTLRRLFLYVMQAFFLAPLIVVLADVVMGVIRLAVGEVGLSWEDHVGRPLVAVVVLAAQWVYHARVAAADSAIAPETGSAGLARRWYVVAFSSFGVALAFGAATTLVRWVLVLLGAGEAITDVPRLQLIEAGTFLVVGLAVWLLFWRWAQQLFHGPSREEQESALRKFYLYALVLIGLLGAVSFATMILAGLLRRALGLQPEGVLADPLSVILTMTVLWGYHSLVLRQDAASATEAPRQAGVRRLYLYLVGTVGLVAVLSGLGGVLSVLIRSLSEAIFDDVLRDQLAWFSAALIAGLPVWALPWQRAQAAAVAETPSGAEERRSVVRKIYLYFFLFVATLTVLAGTVYVVFRVFRLLLGDRSPGNVPGDLGQAIAFSLIGVGVWIYHGLAVRGDGQRGRQAQAERWRALRIAVLDYGEGRLGRAVLDELKRTMPGAVLDPIGLTAAAAASMSGDAAAVVAPETWAERLRSASLIVGPWDITLANGGEGAGTGDLSRLIAASPARKLLIPVRAAGWEWAGVDRWDPQTQVHQVVNAVRQIAEGETVQPSRPLGIGAIIGLVIVGLIVLNVIGSLLARLFE